MGFSRIPFTTFAGWPLSRTSCFVPRFKFGVRLSTEPPYKPLANSRRDLGSHCGHPEAVASMPGQLHSACRNRCPGHARIAPVVANRDWTLLARWVYACGHDVWPMRRIRWRQQKVHVEFRSAIPNSNCPPCPFTVRDVRFSSKNNASS